MKPPPFQYHRPKTLEETLALLKRLDNCCLLAGGQSLVPMLNFRLLYPNDLIDLNGLAQLAGISITDGQIRFGAMTCQRFIELHDSLAGVAPIFREAVKQIGHRQTRNRGTIGGSLCQLDPAGELPALAILHDATMHIASAFGTREVLAYDFIEGAMSPGLRPGEILTDITIPLWPAGHGYAFLEHAKRAGDFALASAGCLVTCGEDGRMSKVAICVGGLGDRPIRLEDAQEHLQGVEPSEAHFAKAAAYCAGIEADGNHHASADYKRAVATALVKRAVTLAISRCKMGAAS